MTDPDNLRDPRAMDDDELAELPDPNPPADRSHDSAVADEEYAEGGTNDSDGAQRDAPAGEDYAGSGF